jgi:hypothetical protein
MLRPIVTFAVLAGIAGCAPRDRSENSAICGITMLASATRVLEQLNQVESALSVAPEGLLEDRFAARVIGYGTTAAVASPADSGRVAARYTGEGFPTKPGFGVALVDDSSEVFRGVLVWDKEPPPAQYPTIGTIGDSSGTMPLIAVLINWESVNSERCPLFAPLDSAAQ